MTEIDKFKLRFATAADAELILSFVRELADYEKLAHEVIATSDDIRNSLFGERRTAEVIIGEYADEAVAFALFFHNYSTFLGKTGIYLEDLYVQPKMRGKGLGKSLLSYLAKLALDRDCGRLEWSVLNWNKPAIDFYESIGAKAMDEWSVYRLTGETLKKAAATN